jgi:uncharacterized membrane protein YjjB (DUF3815 family)
MIWQCFGTGAVALAVRTTGQAADFNLAEASFFAALAVATAERLLQRSLVPKVAATSLS